MRTAWLNLFIRAALVQTHFEVRFGVRGGRVIFVFQQGGRLSCQFPSLRPYQLGLPGACQNVVRAVFVAAFAWGWVPGMCENIVLRSISWGLGLPGACQNVARAVFVVAFVWSRVPGGAKTACFYSML